jgi:glutamyl-Q tRNA(Asp) synthetase
VAGAPALALILGGAAHFQGRRRHWHHGGMAYCGRFAPSPTGQLHFGSLVAALASWLCARHAGGRWLLRVEDIDPPREVPGATAAILAALDRFGLYADAPPLYQSSRVAAYRAALDRLRADGHAFPCWCSRSDLAAAGDMHRDGVCVAAADPSRPPAWRLRVPDTGVGFNDALQGPQRQNLREAVGDFVLLRADGLWAYQLACVVDDAAQGVTEVVRGCDLLDSTPRQIHLQRLLDLPTPRYRHIPLAVDGEGRKLSKSDGDAAVGTADPLPALRAALAFLGLPPAARDGDDAPTVLVNAVAAFDPQNIAPTGCGTRRSTDAFLA